MFTHQNRAVVPAPTLNSRLGILNFRAVPPVGWPITRPSSLPGSSGAYTKLKVWDTPRHILLSLLHVTAATSLKDQVDVAAALSAELT